MNDKKLFFTTWIKISLINFLVVALVGVLLRYKINFPLPVVNYKFLLHAHSHFAFAGWVTQILMALIVQYVYEHDNSINLSRYKKIFRGNFITAYGMLFTFPFQGYGLFSIIFSTLSVFVSYFFIAFVWKDLKHITDKGYSKAWIKASLLLYAISSLGPFSLAYLMANQISGQDLYFGAVYFFLHFQYNGWFLFACFGLFFNYLQKTGFLNTALYSKRIFYVLFITCFPAYFLSTMWMDLPIVIRIVATAAAIAQLISLVYIFKLFAHSKKLLSNNLNTLSNNLWLMVLIAFVIKLLLQCLSTIPSLSQYAFGFRPVVIGYLHLSFLGIITFFILGYINNNLALSRTGVYTFVAGVLITETTLMLQGFEAIGFSVLAYANYVLFAAAIAMTAGLIIIVVKRKRIVNAAISLY
ncbi:MAG TPA: hypothetical protein PLP23_06685 [Panacibacter sp.]|nr:hypothetical protein [Panacibacter sp.]